MLLSDAPVHMDFETRSPADLLVTGAHKYFSHPDTELFGLTFAQSEAAIYDWEMYEAFPAALKDHVHKGRLVVSHNASFERLAWNTKLVPVYDLPELRIEQMRCTMARAFAVGLPGDLDTLAEVMNTRNRKDEAGYNLMLSMSSPLRQNEDGTYVWLDSAEHRERLMLYRRQDVVTEMEVDSMLPELSPSELELWFLDQRINDRGVKVDLPFVYRASDLSEHAKRLANKRLAVITDGKVTKCSQGERIKQWCATRGLHTDTMRKGDFDELFIRAHALGDDELVEVLMIRQYANKTSASKYERMIFCADDNDHRVRGSLQYHAAINKRWGGRLIQPQNFPRVADDGPLVDMTTTALTSDMSTQTICELLPKPLIGVSKSLRSTLIAHEGNVLRWGDFSNIEGRVNAWIADEFWKTDAFRLYDEGKGPDLYNIAYSKSFSVAVESVTKSQRQIGKVQELALGYQGGVNAFIIMALTYNMKIQDITRTIKVITPKDAWEAEAIKYEKSRDKCGLPVDDWTALKIIIKAWRKAHPKITSSWWDLQVAALAAMDNPGTVFQVLHGRVAYVYTSGWLYCRLPSNDFLHYPSPSVKEQVVILVDKNGEEYEKPTRTVRYEGRDKKTGQWGTRYLYGGLQCENVVSATARCILKYAMFNLEDAGYPIILTVHDEIINETSETFGSKAEVRRIMSKVPPYAAGLPIGVSVGEGKRWDK